MPRNNGLNCHGGGSLTISLPSSIHNCEREEYAEIKECPKAY